MFHPIGQGAFYSEQHDNFNMVYDCGSISKNQDILDLSVKRSYNPKDTINVLFISHFDKDHVNKIKILRDNFHIKNVIIPLLHDSEKIILYNFYQNLSLRDFQDETSEDFFNLLNNRRKFFDKETRIIEVKEFERKLDEKQEPIDVEKIPSDKIFSGTILNHGDWIYIPYNFKYEERRKELEKLFLEKNLNFDKFKKDLDYLIKNRSVIKRAYFNLHGKINQNSMTVYSGPDKQEYLMSNGCPLYSNIFFAEDNRAGCIFTGDADLNKTKIDNIYGDYWDKVGTIQIPHHGDYNSFNQVVLNNSSYTCPISFGTDNIFAHPSNQVIDDIYRAGSKPIFITEKQDSLFTQIIKKIP